MAFKYLPVDVARLASVMCVVGPEVKTDPSTGEVKKDRDGNRQWVVGIAAREPGSRRLTVFDVTTVEEPRGVREGAPVRLVGLVASEWEMEGRHGLSWRADEVLPGSPDGAAAAGVRGVKGES